MPAFDPEPEFDPLPAAGMPVLDAVSELIGLAEFMVLPLLAAPPFAAPPVVLPVVMFPEFVAFAELAPAVGLAHAAAEPF
jgi:hypothetical protein